jgi:hypothetical protein
MEKSKKATEKSYKKTRNELQGLPFENMKDKKKAEEKIILDNWKRLSSFKSFKELLERPEFEELRNEFKAGFMCGYSENVKSEVETPDGDDSILKVYKASLGIQIIINEKKPADAELVAQLAKSLTDSFGLLYYKVCGLLPIENSGNSNNPLKNLTSM